MKNFLLHEKTTNYHSNIENLRTNQEIQIKPLQLTTGNRHVVLVRIPFIKIHNGHNLLL